ncbi:hypothetical protein FKP32DRAFT_1054876 [Trametes sanguinea]|nr:hypothetical protein FKP32DRAFT_1054876 [Trametes sanguinea]
MAVACPPPVSSTDRYRWLGCAGGDRGTSRALAPWWQACQRSHTRTCPSPRWSARGRKRECRPAAAQSANATRVHLVTHTTQYTVRSAPDDALNEGHNENLTGGSPELSPGPHPAPPRRASSTPGQANIR